jgi:hypothetical protein
MQGFNEIGLTAARPLVGPLHHWLREQHHYLLCTVKHTCAVQTLATLALSALNDQGRGEREGQQSSSLELAPRGDTPVFTPCNPG